MGRPRTRSDEDLLDSALELLRSDGVGALTFAALSAQCGLSNATLVQRFSTKAELLHRALSRAWDELEARTTELAVTSGRSPEGAVELLVGLSGQYDAFDSGLLLLREDLRDPLLRARGARWEATLVAALDERLPSPVGSALAAQWQGALHWWAFRPDEPLGPHLRERLHGFLDLIFPG